MDAGTAVGFDCGWGGTVVEVEALSRLRLLKDMAPRIYGAPMK